MKKLIKPKALKRGDTVALISLSSGLPAAFPERYRQGKRQLEETFGLKVVETAHSLCSSQELFDHPEWRLEDMMSAFQDPNINGIISNIGGDDTNRLWPLMREEHLKIIHDNPKVFMGFSDTTINHFMCYQAGLSSFYGGANLFTFAENGGIPAYTVETMQKALFSSEPMGVLPESKEFIIDTVDWGDLNPAVRPRRKGDGWHYIQGTKTIQGRLIGGCFDSLITSINGTTLMPAVAEFEGAVLFLECCEEMPTPLCVRIWLRLLGVMGILGKINGLLVGRPGNDIFKSKEEADAWLARWPEYEQVYLDACAEFGRQDLPIVANMDFGHTMPQLVLPYGALCEINPCAKQVRILENAVE